MRAISPGTWLLSAKEAVYKAFFPDFRQPLTWEDVVISFVSDDGMFVSEVRALSDVASYGMVATQDRWIVAVCWIPA
jgi:4'-phosphopantetheinyl transferase EntD